MKRYGNLYPQICDYGNIMLAHEKAKQGKSNYRAVQIVEDSLKESLTNIQSMLLDREFRTSPYRIDDRIVQGKNRRIYKLPYYPDRIVQHAICNICGPIWHKSFIRDTFQSIEGRGTTDARKRVTKNIQYYNYTLKIDINKFYPSINNQILSEIVRRKIKCPNTLLLLDNIIFSTEGLPIGNHISQYLGNLYLTEFDWWIKQELGYKAYFRYCDDMILLSNSKEELWKAFYLICSKLETLSLTVKSNYQIYDLKTEGLDFCGYRFFNNGHMRLRTRIVKQFKANLDNPLSIPAYWGWIKPLKDRTLWYKYTRRSYETRTPK